MASSRLVTALLGVIVSLGLSLLLWQYLGSPVFLLFVPLVPFLFRRGRTHDSHVSVCEACGFQTRDERYEYCPRDGRRLVEQGRE